MNYTYDPNVDYSALMQQALADGNTQLAAIYEQQRNAKIRGENLQDQYPTTSNYAQYLPYQPAPEPEGAMAGVEKTQQAIAQIGKEGFSYDQGKDASYQAYRKQALREADRGTRHTMGAYAGMTQGVPSTAAVTAAQQSGDYYRAQLADKVPEFEANAYSRWLNDQNMRLQKQQLLQSGYRQMLEAENMKWQQQYQERADAYNRSMTLLQNGIMPDAASLAKANISEQIASRIMQAISYSSAGGYRSQNTNPEIKLMSPEVVTDLWTSYIAGDLDLQAVGGILLSYEAKGYAVDGVAASFGLGADGGVEEPTPIYDETTEGWE